MLKVAFIIYRQWGYDIFQEIKKYQEIRKDFSIPLLIVNKNHQCKIRLQDRKSLHFSTVEENDSDTIYKLLKENQVDIACFFSWSWIVDKKTIKDFICLCLHPSLLPRFRGGTPIQHQILKNEKKTGVTIFRMNDVIDGGPIYSQERISLAGNVQDILKRMTDVGTIMTKKLITDAVNTKLKFKPQKNLIKYQPNKRRTPDQSEIKFIELKNMRFSELNNIVRGLLDPYPNVNIIIKEKTMYLQHVEYYENLPDSLEVISGKNPIYINRGNYCLRLKDGYARLIEYKLSK